MKTLLSKPLVLAVLLCLPLWVLFGNFIAALISAILISFFIGMLRALKTLSNNKKNNQ